MAAIRYNEHTYFISTYIYIIHQKYACVPSFNKIALKLCDLFAVKQTERQADGQTGGQTDRRTGKTDRHKYILSLEKKDFPVKDNAE